MSDSSPEKIALTQLSRKQRRVLGTLLEKAFTTPDQYPLTLKAAVAGCNQKSNRDPVTNYDEDDVATALEELREIGFVGEVHTEGGRTERYRHYLRHRTDLTEAQMAVMTELMLRGRQQVGELRTRASRMVAIPSLEELRDVLQSLLERGMVRANGSLERRGIEVDHNLYNPGENRETLSELGEEPAAGSAPVRVASAVAPKTSEQDDTIAELQSAVSDLRNQVEELKEELAELRRQLGA
ncbi:DUF480 domain-containing protein [bacterium]|nr:DUF480 domain-containing protein [bacterium]